MLAVVVMLIAWSGWVYFRAPFLIGYFHPPLMKTLSANIRRPLQMPRANTHIRINTNGPFSPPHPGHRILTTLCWAPRMLEWKGLSGQNYTLKPSPHPLLILMASLWFCDFPFVFVNCTFKNLFELIGKQTSYICGKQMCFFSFPFFLTDGEGMGMWLMNMCVCVSM